MGLLEKRLNPHRVIEAGLPMYSLDGRQKRKHHRIRIPNALLVCVCIILGLSILIYLPPALISDSDPYHLPSVKLAADETALADAVAYLKNHPDEDFDGDGLTNEQEAEHGTDPYSVDSDGDGVTDYAELYVTETNPRISDDTIIRYMKSLDAESGKQVNSPIKIYNVVLWPSDYASRARGGVVRTLDGYRFCNFTGWAQFPDGGFAYKVVNGVHIPLKQNESGYFYIDDPVTTVHVFAQQLEMKHRLSVLGKDFILSDGGPGQVLSFLLPSRGVGLLTCRRVAAADVEEPEPQVSRLAEIVLPDSFQISNARFGRNFNKLADLASILEAIDDGQCVILSLYSYEAGEAFVLAYGYNSLGNILVADINTGEPLGAINFEERAGRFLDHTGEIQQYEWFLFEGCGFSSSNGHRIAIIGYIDAAGSTDHTEALEEAPAVKEEISPDIPEMESAEEEPEAESVIPDEDEPAADVEKEPDTDDRVEPDAPEEPEGVSADPVSAPAYQPAGDPSEFVYLPDIPLSEELQEFTYLVCQEKGLEYELVLALMWRESRFEEGAVGFNTNGTRDNGLMQINDVNRGWLYDYHGISDLMDPRQNIMAGTTILAEHMERFGDETVAVMAYGAGGAGAQRQLDRGITTTAGVDKALSQRDVYRSMLSAV